MHKPNLKFLASLTITLLFTFCASAQFTETFESQTPGVNYFRSNGTNFTLTNSFFVFSSRTGIGYNGSNRFIDNSGNTQKNQLNSIKTTNLETFSVYNMWIFISSDAGENPTANGSLIVTGKRNGVPVFSFTKTSGFNTSYNNSGFTYLDFKTEGSTDFSLIAIDELSFQLAGDFNYLGIDNFTWTTHSVLPVSLVTFEGSLQKDGTVALNWETTCESNSDYFSIEKSKEGISFAPISKVKAAGYCATTTKYSAIDGQPVSGNSFYRLVLHDLNGSKTYFDIIKIENKSTPGLAAYPNPATGIIKINGLIKNKYQTYNIYSTSGMFLKSGVLKGSDDEIDVSSLSRGQYFITLSGGQKIILQKD